MPFSFSGRPWRPTAPLPAAGLALVLNLSLAPITARAQVGIGTLTPDPAAALDVSAADKGLLIPRLTATARRAIGAPPQGMLVFQTGSATTAADSVGIWYATGQGRRWLYLPSAQQSQLAATNGLTRTGNTVALGGALSQPTTTISGGLNQILRFSTDGTGVVTLDQVQLASSAGNSFTSPRWQSFTAGTSQALVRVEVKLDVFTPGILVCNLHQGTGLAGTVLHSQPLLSGATGMGQVVSITLTVPLPLVAGQVYTLALSQASGVHNWHYAIGNPYPGGRTDFNANFDRYFATYTAPILSQGVALAGGQVRLTGLSGPALLNVAADGTVGTQPVPAGDNLGNHLATQTLVLNDNSLHLRGATDAAQTLAYDVTSDGPRLSGFGGGELGTRTTAGAFSTALRWTSNRRVGIGLTGAPAQALDVNGNIAASGSLGVLLNDQNRPLITRSTDPFTSGVYQGAGRWGMFKESPGTLLFGIPVGGTGRSFSWVQYAANSAVASTLMRLSQAGDLTVSGQVQMGWEQIEQTYSLAGNTRIVLYLNCPTGTRLLGGGGGHRDANAAAADINVRYSGPDPNSPTDTWRLILSNTSGSSRAVRAYCMCARIAN